MVGNKAGGRREGGGREGGREGGRKGEKGGREGGREGERDAVGSSLCLSVVARALNVSCPSLYYVLTHVIALTLQSVVLCLSEAHCITVYRFYQGSLVNVIPVCRQIEGFIREEGRGRKGGRGEDMDPKS